MKALSPSFKVTQLRTSCKICSYHSLARALKRKKILLNSFLWLRFAKGYPCSILGVIFTSVMLAGIFCSHWILLPFLPVWIPQQHTCAHTERVAGTRPPGRKIFLFGLFAPIPDLLKPKFEQIFREMVKDREAWHAAVHGATKSWTWLSNWTTTKV